MARSTNASQIISSKFPAGSGPIASIRRRIALGFEINHDNRMLDGVLDGLVVNTVLARQPVDLHTRLS